jgi:hypothetical protein
MTIPADNWCSACQEACHDHATICTVCGDALGAPPARTSRASSSSITGVRAVPEFLSEETRQASRELRSVLTSLRGQIQDLDAMARDAIGNNNEEWQSIPAALLEPQNSSRGRPTSKATLAQIPRIVLNDKSSLFRQTTLEISSGSQSLQFQTIPGEFGPSDEIQLTKSSVIVAGTGKGGLNKDTKAKINQGGKPIVYMERGDGITFVKKAILAQELGATAVIIGNNMADPWPYVMKDSKREADECGLAIPVAMVKQSDGKIILDYCREHSSVSGNLRIQSLSKDCVVCCETFGVSQTVLQLPACGHVFHETCALAWLTKQNTCPYCRRELPTDDQDYENERRRVQRTHAGSASNSNDSGWSGFYG